MLVIDHFKGKGAARRRQEEVFYAAALQEIENGTIRPGLWAKALANAGDGDEAVKFMYLSLLVQRLQDDAEDLKRTQKHGI